MGQLTLFYDLEVCPIMKVDQLTRSGNQIKYQSIGTYCTPKCHFKIFVPIKKKTLSTEDS